METQDEEEQLDESIENQQEAVQDYYEDTSPTEVEKETLYGLFRWCIDKKDSSKISNLDKQELGMLDMSVRDCQNIAIFCDSLGYTEVAKWLRAKAEITLSTSSSKKGWLPELFVSAKKFSSKEKKMGIPEGLPSPTEKRSFWGRKK